jgi:hypothetical protein
VIGAVWGCAANTETESKVTAIVPAAAFNDSAFPALIQGDAFRPIYRFDTMAAPPNRRGTFSATLTPVGGARRGGDRAGGRDLAIAVGARGHGPAGVPAGRYDVGVTDPRGRKMQLERVRLAGIGHGAPLVDVDAAGAGRDHRQRRHRPGDAGRRRRRRRARDAGRDRSQRRRWTIATSRATSRRRAQHLVPPSFGAPAPVDENDAIIITPYATDSVGHDAERSRRRFTLAPRPSLTSATPTVGPASGGTEIVVRGSDFIEGTVLLFGSQCVQPTSDHRRPRSRR